MGKSKSSSLVDTQVIYCGDNLEELVKLPNSCIDLIYIDPPFNANKNYEVFWGETQETRRFTDTHESTQAYIEFMKPRCTELARVLKKTGSFYCHCDWHGSHYLKMMLDQIFGEQHFRNEIIWKRANTVKGNFGQGSKLWSPNTDSIFFYTKGDNYTFNPQFMEYSDDYVAKCYKYAEPDGRRYQLISMTGPGGGAKGNPQYEVMGVTRYWRYSQPAMKELIGEGLVVQTKPGNVPRRKQYLDKGRGVAIQTLWDDVDALSAQSRERLGWPTQKPLALLERIISAGSNKGDVVLDAFCGCGTALVAAENLGRQWIGIDISPTACNVMAKRMRKVCHLQQGEALWRNDRGFVVRDLPWTIDRLRKLPPVEFENWAVLSIGGTPNTAHVGDKGIDGRVYLVSHMPTEKAHGLSFMDNWYPIQVKQKDRAGRPDIQLFEAAMHGADRHKGIFVSFDYSSDALVEIQRFFEKEHRVIVPLTVQEILDKNIGPKLT
jgi:DNA modification methylase